MPWPGTRRGPQPIVSTCQRVGRYRKNEGLTIDEILGAGGSVAVSGRFTYRSTTLGKAIAFTCPIAAKVSAGRVTCLQCMEDTYGTASNFRSAGNAIDRIDPHRGEIDA